MKHFVFATAFILLFSYTANSQTISYDKLPAGEYAIDPAHASITWKVNHLGLSNYTARFTKIDAKIVFDPKDPAKSKITATIDPFSLRTDYPYREKEDFDKKLIENKEWLNAKKFPKIEFVSSKIEKTGDNEGKISGALTFLGITKPVVLNAKFNGGYSSHPFAKVPAMGFSAHTTLKRSEWGFIKYVPTIGDEVSISIEVEFHKKK